MAADVRERPFFFARDLAGLGVGEGCRIFGGRAFIGKTGTKESGRLAGPARFVGLVGWGGGWGRGGGGSGGGGGGGGVGGGGGGGGGKKKKK